ncbi:MAG: hypothetical protein ACO3TH_01505 [Lutimaribacter sp.]
MQHTAGLARHLGGEFELFGGGAGQLLDRGQAQGLGAGGDFGQAMGDIIGGQQKFVDIDMGQPV